MESKSREAVVRVPVVVTRNFVLFPERAVPLVINRPQSVAAVNASVEQFDSRVIVVAQRKETGDGSKVFADDPYRVGVLARIDRKIGDNKRGFQLIVTGLQRVRLGELNDT